MNITYFYVQSVSSPQSIINRFLGKHFEQKRNTALLIRLTINYTNVVQF